MSLVLRRHKIAEDLSRIYYCKDKFIPYSNVNGLYFKKEVYILCYVEDFNPQTGDINLYRDPQKITEQHYNIWLEEHNSTFSQLEVKCMYCTQQDPHSNILLF